MTLQNQIQIPCSGRVSAIASRIRTVRMREAVVEARGASMTLVADDPAETTKAVGGSG
jgi:hypothetical protein